MADQFRAKILIFWQAFRKKFVKNIVKFLLKIHFNLLKFPHRLIKIVRHKNLSLPAPKFWLDGSGIDCAFAFSSLLVRTFMFVVGMSRSLSFWRLTLSALSAHQYFPPHAPDT
jgi:hypothetical protein